jgi:hypothetical protein
MEKLKVGDVVLSNYTTKTKFKNLVKIFKLQDLVDGGDANHAAIYVGDDKVMESLWLGVTYRKREILNNPHYAVMRLKKEVNNEKMSDLIEKYYNKYHGLGYSYKGLLNASLSSFVNFIVEIVTFGHKSYKPVIFKEEKKPFCSELVAEIYEEYTGKNFSVSNDVISPNDLMEDKRFKIIQEFGTKNG